MSTSADPINVEVALFVVPDRNDFSTVKLCPGLNKLPSEIAPVFDTNGWDTWVTVDEMSIEGCSMKKFDSSVCIPAVKLPKDQFNNVCVDEMPPSHEFSFTTNIPINNKWSWSSANEKTLSNQPEYLIDINHVYYFSYDSVSNSIVILIS